MQTILYIVPFILAAGLVWGFLMLKATVQKSIGDNFLGGFEKIDSVIRDEFSRNREESQKGFKDSRTELNDALIKNRGELSDSLKSFETQFSQNVKEFNEIQRQKFGDLTNNQEKLRLETETKLDKIRDTVEKKLQSIQEDNSKKLEEMRKTVDEKLQKTLDERLGKSFELVSKQLESVQKGLGEMQTLAQDVGGLKKVLSNVKMRGGIGEMQLSMLLEQILAPEQYEANVKTKKGSSDMVEFAVKLPGKNGTGDSVYLPIDAKFPKDAYEQLVDAYESADIALIDKASKNIETVIKSMAKDIRDKYIDPPNTTDFGIMFLPFEGIYGEVVRRVSLMEQLQRDFKVVVTGPTILAAYLNSLQMGFKTLAIQKRSSEVWEVLKAVKTEFHKFGGVLESAKKKMEGAQGDIDELLGARTKKIQIKLRDVETLAPEKAQNLLEPQSESELPNED
jgi:DNA recombination protein RmuC